MEKAIVEKAFSLSDSVYLVLLVGLALGTWWIIRWILSNQKEIMKTNNEREGRYIETIGQLANVDGLKKDVAELRKDVNDGNERQELMLGRLLDRWPPKGGE